MNTSSLNHQNRCQRPILIGDVKRATKAGPPESPRNRGPGVSGGVAVLTQMRQHDSAQPWMMELGEQLRRRPVGQVPG